jgi:hypothetical protein
MPISVNIGTKIIYIPQSYLTFVSGVQWTLDTNQLRLDLRDWEDSEEGIIADVTHNHATSITLSGVTYSRFLEIINGYQVEFEDTGAHYTVICQGTNHNLADVMVLNAVNLIIGNSAGLIEVATGGTGTTAQEVWEYPFATGNTSEEELTKARKAAQTGMGLSA